MHDDRTGSYSAGRFSPCDRGAIFHRLVINLFTCCVMSFSFHSIFMLSYWSCNHVFALFISITVRSRFVSILMISLRLIVMSRTVLRRKFHQILHLSIYQLFQVDPATVLSVRSRVILQVIVISFSFLYFFFFFIVFHHLVSVSELVNDLKHHPLSVMLSS